ncbi:hypothetical protein LEMLEM_LOCUS5058, partial [Lemmus lemmus]
GVAAAPPRLAKTPRRRQPLRRPGRPGTGSWSTCRSPAHSAGRTSRRCGAAPARGSARSAPPHARALVGAQE